MLTVVFFTFTLNICIQISVLIISYMKIICVKKCLKDAHFVQMDSHVLLHKIVEASKKELFEVDCCVVPYKS